MQKITCVEREKMIAGDQWDVCSGFTDMDGEWGDPRMETVWVRDGVYIRDVRHPNPEQGADLKPCEHWLFDGEPS